MEAVKNGEEMKRFEKFYAQMKKDRKVKRKYLKKQFCRRLEELGKGRKQAEVSLK
ncbi:MAG: hypothetical protein GY820_28530 [Gammaproteobacteria bacterium]|nr:hypothetical protein [Gammaproteobacteria bacterium]